MNVDRIYFIYYVIKYNAIYCLLSKTSLVVKQSFIIQTILKFKIYINTARKKEKKVKYITA